MEIRELYHAMRRTSSSLDLKISDEAPENENGRWANID